jgi:hypothetical protein
MDVAQPSDGTTDPAQRGPASAWTGSVYGLQVEADLPVLGLDPCEADPLGPRTLLRESDLASIDAKWSSSGSEQLFEWRYPDGRLGIAVETHPSDGYRVDAPEYGYFRVASDGSLIECAPVPGPPWKLGRALFAQALPIAACLNGIELLHASGVVIDGRAIGFAGHSGTGKTSLAIHLVDQGAELLTDDVLALSADGDTLCSHRGPRLANVASEQIESLPPRRRSRLGNVIGDDDKAHILINPLAEAPAPLGALYFVERQRSIREVSFERLMPPNPRWVLAGAFIPRVTSPARMKAQLDVCSLIVSQVATFRLRVPPDLGAAKLAHAVGEHIHNSKLPHSGA